MKAIFDQIYSNISKQKTKFFLVFFVVVLITYAILYALDFYPEPIEEEVNEETETEVLVEETEVIEVVAVTDNEEKEVEENISVVTNEPREFSIESSPVAVNASLVPNRIVIPKSGTDVVILNPASVDMNDLDNALLSGVIRHPQSADFDDKGNMLILGHSSYLPNVFNKNFQAFNGVQNLVWGDEIVVYGEDGGEKTYRVDRVYLAKASETVIDNSWGKSKLTLVTCNSFASKDDRYIVEATLVKTS